MSNFKAPVRDYNFSDGRLIEIANEKLEFATRDAAELVTVGISAGFLTALDADIKNFGELPSDETELGEQEEATEEKDEVAEEVREYMRNMRSAAQRCFGINSPRYHQFGLEEMTKFTDSELLRRALVAHQVAVTYATELDTKGYTALDNSAFKARIEVYVKKIKEKAMEVGSRDIAQETRVLKGNALYHHLEDELCEAAKNYWRTRSAAKYNDYIIYNNETGTEEPPVPPVEP